MVTSGSQAPSPGRNAILLGIAGLVLMAVVGLSYREWLQYNRASADAIQARTVVDSIDHLLASLLDAETGQRGFLLTGEDRYLEPYNRAVREIPAELSAASRLLATRSGQSANAARLNALTTDKLAELRETIELRRTRGIALSLSMVLSDRGKQTMDGIRAIAGQIRGSETSSQSQAFTEGEVAAGTALLATIAGAVVLLFLFAFGLEPFASPEPQAWRRSSFSRYGAAVLAVVATALLRGALTPLIGRTNLPFTMFFYAVAFAAWFGGFRPAVLSIVLSLLIGSWFFAAPTGSLLVSGRDDQVAMLMIVVVGFGVALLSRAQRNAVERAGRERQRFETTLASIGDAVITTDTEGRITLLNPVAQAVTGWTNDEAAGKPLEQVFVIRNQETGVEAENPVTKVLREGRIVGLANHTQLIARNGSHIPIDDSAAPIRDSAGATDGVVMVFRDVTVQRRAQATSRLLASIVESSDDAIIGKDLEGAITSWNRGAERIFGYSAEEAIGKPVSMIAAPGREDEMPGILERISNGERVDHFETLRRTKDGKLVNVSLTVSPVHDANGRIVGASKIARDISEQVRARAQIAELAERLRITLNSIGDAVISTDPNGTVTYSNPVAERLTGWPLAECAGKPLPEVFRIVNEETRHTVENPVSKALREGRIAGLANHTVLIARNGTEYAIDDSAAPIHDADGKIAGVVMVFRDNTANREKEKRLDEQAAELRRITDLMEPVACFVRDLDDRIVYWNPGAADLYGFSKDEAIGQVSHALLQTQFPAPLDDILTQLRTAGAWQGELRHTRRDGEQITVASRWALHKDTDSRPAAILEVNLNITERKEAELRLARAQEQLAQELSGTRALHQLASRLMALNELPSLLEEILAAARTITSADKGNIQLLGSDGALRIAAQHGFSQQFLDCFNSVHKDDAASCGAALARGARVIVEDVERSPIFAGTPALNVLLADHVRAVQSTPMVSRAGVAVGVLSTHYQQPRQLTERDLRLLDLLALQAADLIERLRVDHALRNLNAALQRANEDLNQFAFAANHDLQEPLRMITSYSQLLLQGYRGQLDGEAATCISFITDGTRRMRELLADLLTYTQLTGDAPETATPVDLNEVLQAALENCRAAIEETEGIVTSDRLPPVLGHRPHFLQLFQNLLSNGLKYHGELPPSIHLSAESQNGLWRIAVKDNGIGIAPEYHQQIFGVFKRLHGRTIPGTGIGLAICQRVINRYGGQIWVESEVDRGATFYFTLPIAHLGASHEA